MINFAVFSRKFELLIEMLITENSDATLSLEVFKFTTFSFTFPLVKNLSSNR